MNIFISEKFNNNLMNLNFIKLIESLPYNFEISINPLPVFSLISTIHSKSLKNLWIFDTGASYNICNNLEYFIKIDYHSQPYSTDFSISDDQIQILGEGKVEL